MYDAVQFEQPHQTTAYKLTNLKMAKRLWKIAVEHHAFFRSDIIMYHFFLLSTAATLQLRSYHVCTTHAWVIGVFIDSRKLLRPDIYMLRN